MANDWKKVNSRIWYFNNLTRAKAIRKKWAESNKEKVKGYKKKYYLKHKELIKERTIIWRKENPNKVKEIYRRVYAKNVNKYSFYHKERETRKRANGGSHTFEEWRELLKLHNYICWGCKRINLELTEDHKIPLIKGGTNYINNIQPLCRSCNSKKRDKLNFWFQILS